MSKILTVFGATGNQGGSVIKTILADPALSKEFKIRGVTRDVSKPAAQALSAKGVEMVSADMSSQDAVAPALKDAHTVFLVTNFWESLSKDVEVGHGKTVTDAAKAAGVQHLIFSSLLNVSKITKGRFTNVKHFDGKAEVEDYIRASGIPCTFVLAGAFMQNFFQQIITKNEDGSYTVAMPCHPTKAQFPMFDAAGDTGKFVKAAIKNKPSGRRILAATNYMNPEEITKEFGEVMGKPASYYQLPAETFKSYLPEPIKEEMYENLMLFENEGYYEGASLDESLALLDEEPTTWKHFVEQNKQNWQ